MTGADVVVRRGDVGALAGATVERGPTGTATVRLTLRAPERACTCTGTVDVGVNGAGGHASLLLPYYAQIVEVPEDEN